MLSLASSVATGVSSRRHRPALRESGCHDLQLRLVGSGRFHRTVSTLRLLQRRKGQIHAVYLGLRRQPPKRRGWSLDHDQLQLHPGDVEENSLPKQVSLGMSKDVRSILERPHDLQGTIPPEEDER